MKEAKDFSIEQAPDVYQQIIDYGVYVHGTYLVLAVLLGITLAYCLKRAFNLIREYNKAGAHEDGKYVPRIVGFLLASIFCSVFSFGLILDHLDKFLTVVVAPKVYVIQFLSQ